MRNANVPMITPTQTAPKPTNISSRGFTLTELMAVVAIVGILATVAAVSYRGYIAAAKSSEAVVMMNGIRAAQEAYRADTLVYLDVSTSLGNYYPADAPGRHKTQWGGDSALGNRWKVLNVTSTDAVYYRYAVVAGHAGTDPVSAPGIHGEFTVVADPQMGNEPWYMMQAIGDLNGDGTMSYCLGSSFSSDIYWIREGQ